MEDILPDIIDTHCHLDLFPSPDNVANKINKKAIHVIAVTNAPSVFWYTKNISDKSDYIHASIGLHPELVKTHAKEISHFFIELPNTRFVGEIGLDYSTKLENERKRQRDVFQQIIEHCASSTDKVLSIHSRRAVSDVMSIVGDNFPGSIILHWFSGTNKELEKAISYGYYFSVNTAMCSSLKGKEIIRSIPQDQILTESDGPFIQYKSSPVAPWDVEITIDYLSTIWQCTKNDAAKKIMRNFMIILGNQVGNEK